jgi:hypothetical protein
MITSGTVSRQPKREVWTPERLRHEQAIALGHAIDTTTWRNYSSALNSYLEFVKNHHLPVVPTPQTLSLYTVYLSHFIKPASVDTYLSGICQQLEPLFPDIRTNRKTPLVRRTLDGCKHMRAIPTTRKRALTIENLKTIMVYYAGSKNHDDLLFTCMILVGFFALMRLGELAYPDSKSTQNPNKISRRTSVEVHHEFFQFFLPSHKADKFFEGNIIMLPKITPSGINIFRYFAQYLQSRDAFFPYSSPLWLRTDGTIPTRSFVIKRLKIFFTNDISGQSLRAGGATALAENGTPPSLIQASGHWSSDAFRIYVRKNPVMIQALLHAQNTNE